jgi:GAF domain-containing protein
VVPSSQTMAQTGDLLQARGPGLAILGVLAVAGVKWLFGITDPAYALLLFSLVVAFSAAAAGFRAASVAALTSVLIARLSSSMPLSASLLFAIETLLLALLVSTLAEAVEDDGRLFEQKDRRIRELDDEVRRLSAIELAYERLEREPLDYAVAVLDFECRVTAWRDSAARLFRRDRSVEGQPVFNVIGATIDDRLGRAMGAARSGGVGTFEARVERADGSTFDADFEIRSLTSNRFDGFLMLVRDRTREQEWNAFAAASADAQVVLREEADIAHRQLATLQHVTDPMLNLLPPAQTAVALLDRLRAAIDADGVALIRIGPFRRRIVSLNDTLLAQGAAERRQNDARSPQDDRILVIQNDAARVAALSLVNWPETVSSLIAVPVVSGGTIEGTIEVVGMRSRRSTEWEIALVQVVAARIAGRLQDESYLDAGAVA